MFKKEITFDDFDGNQITEVFYFNISRAEMAEMELSKEGGMGAWLTKVGESEDGTLVMDEFKKIIEATVGRRSEDKRRFIKDQEAKDDFFQSNAYDALLWEMLTDPQASVEFVKGVMPKDLVEAWEKGEEILPGTPANEKELKEVTNVVPQEEKDTRPAWEQEDREPTQKELMAMTKEEIAEAFRRKQRK